MWQEKVSHSPNKKPKRKRKTIKLLLEQIKEREDQLSYMLDNSKSTLLGKQITESRQKLNVEFAHKGKGATFRSKSKWFKEGEHNTKYFFNLEKTTLMLIQ